MRARNNIKAETAEPAEQADPRQHKVKVPVVLGLRAGQSQTTDSIVVRIAVSRAELVVQTNLPEH